MASPAQVLASRANGQRSKGPRSVEGKAASSRNSLKLGITAKAIIIPGEDPADLARLTAEYHAHYQPVGPIEAALLENAVRAEWMKHRYYRLEAAVLNQRIAAQPDNEYAIGAAFDQDAQSGNALQRLFRRQQAADRDWRDALQTLERMQSHRLAEAEAEAEAEEITSDEEDNPQDALAALADAPGLPRVRFDDDHQPTPTPATEPPLNLALRL